MPFPNLILMVLIGVVIGGIFAVVLHGRRTVFFVNILLGIIGALLGAFFPVVLGQAVQVDTGSGDYLLRALLGAFLLVMVASLFRPARPRGTS